MTRLRRLLRRHHRIAAWLVMLALALKLIVPAGFMPIAAADGTITVQICSGAQTAPRTVEIAVPGLPAGSDDRPAPAQADMPCAFAGLAMPMVGGTDAALLVAAIAFVMAIAIARAANPPFGAPTRLRPPLRGPPARA